MLLVRKLITSLVVVILILVITIPLIGSANAKSKTAESGTHGLYVLTADELLRLDGKSLTPVKKLNGTFSKVTWDRGHFYLGNQNNLLILDAEFKEVGSYKVAGHVITDFDVHNGVAYLLMSNALLLVDINEKKPIKHLYLEPYNIADSIIVRGNYAYIIDDVAMPAFMYIIDIHEPRNPVKNTMPYGTVGGSLQTQDVNNGKWYILESYEAMGIRGGLVSGQVLDVFGSRPQALKVDAMPMSMPTKQYYLVTEETDSEGNIISKEGGNLIISSIKVEGSLVYSLGHNGCERCPDIFSIFSLNPEKVPFTAQNQYESSAKAAPRVNTFQKAVYDQINSGQVVGSKEFTDQFLGLIPSLQIPVPPVPNPQNKQLAVLELNDSGHPSNICSSGKTVYVGGEKGVYVIDVSSPRSPVITQVIKTDSPVRYLLSR